jgi:hypothetical protein
MNRYRFYEILQAHKRGEDLSVFTPKNAPEAALLADLQGGKQSNVIVSAHRPVPNTGVVGKVHLNTLLTKEEIIEIVSQLTYTPNGNRGLDVYYVFRAEGGMRQTWAVYRKDGEYSIGNDTEGVCFFASSIDVNINSEPYNNFEGFEAGMEGTDVNLEINGNVVSTHYSGASVGTENDKLAKLFSIDPFVIATPVPNSGYVDKIYFNRNTDSYHITTYYVNKFDGVDHYILATEDKSHVVVFNCDTQDNCYIKDIITGEIYFVSGDYRFDDEGNFINDNLPEVFEINGNLVDEIEIDGQVHHVGIDNVYSNETTFTKYVMCLKTIPSDEVTPISGDYNGETLTVNANGEIDVKELLSNKKLPLKIVVNVNE